jgi:hypothetical protein
VAQSPVDIDLTGDADDPYLAVSGTGDATCWAPTGLLWLPEVVLPTGNRVLNPIFVPAPSCVAITGLGDASCHHSWTSGNPWGYPYYPQSDFAGACVALSGIGDAGGESGKTVAISGTGNSTGMLAYSAEGHSRATHVAGAVAGDTDSGLVAATGVGTAKAGWVAVSGADLSGQTSTAGYATLVGVGHSDAGWLAGSVAGDSHGGLVAATGSGASKAGGAASSVGGDSNGGVLGASGLGNSTGNVALALVGNTTGQLLAISGQRDATACGALACTAVSVTGNATGGIAIAPVGHASGRLSVSACNLDTTKTACLSETIPNLR